MELLWAVESPNGLVIYIDGKLYASDKAKFVGMLLDEPTIYKNKNKMVIILINCCCPRSSHRCIQH